MNIARTISMLVVFFCTLAAAQDDTLVFRHPGFQERIAEREALVRELAAYGERGISDQKVLDVMGKVPRHLFVPEEHQAYAYVNSPLPIGYRQTISQPYIVASMTQMLNVHEGEKILEVGTGSGYQAAVLAELGCRVYSIEIIPELGERAKILLEELGYSNINVKNGNGYEGWSEYAPYDKIIVTCAPEEIPLPLVAQLSPKGIIVIPVGGENEVQYLIVLKRDQKGKLIREYKYPVRFVPMTGKPGKD